MRNITLAAFLMLAVAPLAANAADGTITFVGKVTDKTCTISSPQGLNQTVTLPTVSKSTLNGVGKVAGRTPFSINLSKCSPGNVATYFEQGATVDFATGRLNNQAAALAAKNVQIQLLGSNSLFLPVLAIGASGAQANSQWVTVSGTGVADLNYYAEYYATAAAEAGDVSTSVQYTIIYN